MLNRGLNCVTRPSRLDLIEEQAVNPISGYGIIPLLAAAGTVGMGFLDSRARKKQAKRDARAEKKEIARQQAAMEAASRQKQMVMVLAVGGIIAIGAIAFAYSKKRK